MESIARRYDGSADFITAATEKGGVNEGRRAGRGAGGACWGSACRRPGRWPAPPRRRTCTSSTCAPRCCPPHHASIATCWAVSVCSGCPFPSIGAPALLSAQWCAQLHPGKHVLSLTAASAVSEAALHDVQITVWGTSGDGDSEVSDYANKQWGGLLSTFYHTRCLPHHTPLLFPLWTRPACNEQSLVKDNSDAAPTVYRPHSAHRVPWPQACSQPAAAVFVSRDCTGQAAQRVAQASQLAGAHRCRPMLHD